MSLGYDKGSQTTSVVLPADPSALAAGETVATRQVAITRDNLVRYAGASGDFNPIHYRDDVATAVGLPGVLAHGMLTMGLASALVRDWLGEAGRTESVTCRFTRPVPVPASGAADLSITATVGAVDEDARRARIDTRVELAGQTVLGKSQMWVSFSAGER